MRTSQPLRRREAVTGVVLSAMGSEAAGDTVNGSKDLTAGTADKLAGRTRDERVDMQRRLEDCEVDMQRRLEDCEVGGGPDGEGCRRGVVGEQRERPEGEKAVHPMGREEKHRFVYDEE